jgi:hypothetical protein
MLIARNMLSHVYDEKRFREALREIEARFLPILNALRKTLDGQVGR